MEAVVWYLTNYISAGPYLVLPTTINVMPYFDRMASSVLLEAGERARHGTGVFFRADVFKLNQPETTVHLEGGTS
jgi:hypothetical protein